MPSKIVDLDTNHLRNHILLKYLKPLLAMTAQNLMQKGNKRI